MTLMVSFKPSIAAIVTVIVPSSRLQALLLSPTCYKPALVLVKSSCTDPLGALGSTELKAQAPTRDVPNTHHPSVVCAEDLKDKCSASAIELQEPGKDRLRSLRAAGLCLTGKILSTPHRCLSAAVKGGDWVLSLAKLYIQISLPST